MGTINMPYPHFADKEEYIAQLLANLQKLAKWLVSLDRHPLLVNHPTKADMEAIIRRAREALNEDVGDTTPKGGGGWRR